ncbi:MULTISPECIES: HDIG domain-containing metalloprotein [unclassified Desulfovibrio]|uniref:HDIG domain-containing metalloprotein n=1 Tax=unclassified Desulfovibrio TaxID=2593640 RepID=UPI000F5D8F33|nr:MULTISPECIES: HDIG domain-containing metalloprotein [unclassified Desulfovibrio]RRD71216.1 HDIG domain-containing protein [Desulfovibrio sp. OH1209_COT-279]RRD87504.1 HDIG domain-containing protein [Desulfovibrio sp. OH1186_COT-070]
MKNSSAQSKTQAGAGKRPLSQLPQLSLPCAAASVPDDDACFALWDKYDMLPNIRRHSLLVAHVAECLARRAADMGMNVRVPEVRASALLHDIAKTYCVRYGGSHAQLGAAWTVAETGNHAVAQGVMMHVWWPWPLPQGAGICSLPFFVIYADKRVRHDRCVSLEERYEDLLERYGCSESAREGIREAHRQGKMMESALAAQLEWAVHEDSFDCGRVVA